MSSSGIVKEMWEEFGRDGYTAKTPTTYVIYKNHRPRSKKSDDHGFVYFATKDTIQTFPAEDGDIVLGEVQIHRFIQMPFSIAAIEDQQRAVECWKNGENVMLMTAQGIKDRAQRAANYQPITNTKWEDVARAIHPEVNLIDDITNDWLDEVRFTPEIEAYQQSLNFYTMGDYLDATITLVALWQLRALRNKKQEAAQS